MHARQSVKNTCGVNDFIGQLAGKMACETRGRPRWTLILLEVPFSEEARCRESRKSYCVSLIVSIIPFQRSLDKLERLPR